MKSGQSVVVLSVVMVFLVLSAGAHGQANPKKLIEYGWDVRQPSYVAEHIREMEKKPFDGIMMVAEFSHHVFWKKEVDEKAIAAEMEALKKITWEKFTDNFIMMHSRSNMDWFSDEDWKWVLRNVGICAKAAQAGRCVGVCFDPEPFWGRGPWRYEEQPRADEKSFAQFQEMVRKRGAQFMDRIEEEFPNPVIHTFFLSSHLHKAAVEPDPVKRREILKGEFYGLWPAFVNGMLEAADPGTIITDGNEPSYYYSEPLQFFKSYHDIHQTAQALIPLELRSKYRAQVQCAQAIYVEYLCGMRAMHTTGSYLTPKERAKWVEHNVYYGLKSSDRYVWYYSQYMNWWTGWNIPEGMEAAIRSAREKIKSGQPLGFDIAAMVARASQALTHAKNRPIEPKTARVPRVVPGGARPKIYGRLDDAVWAEAVELGPFVPFAVASRKTLEAKTLARIAYDEKHLYISVRCEEPEKELIQPTKFQDRLSWSGDHVEVIISDPINAARHRHIAVNPDNGRWDGIFDGKTEAESDKTWSPEYQSATAREKGFWAVEMAVPWASLRMGPPTPGDKLKGNLIRRTARRRTTHFVETSTWSERRRSRAPEVEHFGTWVFE